VGAALVPIVFSLKLIPNVYRVPVIDLCTQGVFTNTAPTAHTAVLAAPKLSMLQSVSSIWQQMS